MFQIIEKTLSALDLIKIPSEEAITLDNLATQQYPDLRRVRIRNTHVGGVSDQIRSFREGNGQSGGPQRPSGETYKITEPYHKYTLFRNKVWALAISALRSQDQLHSKVSQDALARLVVMTIPHPDFFLAFPGGSLRMDAAKRTKDNHHSNAGWLARHAPDIPQADFEPIVTQALNYVKDPSQSKEFTKMSITSKDAMSGLLHLIAHAHKQPLSPQLSLEILTTLDQMLPTDYSDSGMLPKRLVRIRQLIQIRKFVSSVTPYLSNDEFNATARENMSDAITTKATNQIHDALRLTMEEMPDKPIIDLFEELTF